jgi:hypothetical protein
MLSVPLRQALVAEHRVALREAFAPRTRRSERELRRLRG